MKILFAILLIPLMYEISYGQSYSFAIDSLTKATIKKMPIDKKNKFYSILKQRVLFDFYKRIDTTTSEFIFVEEEYYYKDSIGYLTERYFCSDDTFPKYFYANGEPLKYSHKDHFDALNRNLDTEDPRNKLFEEYSKLKATQASLYNKIQFRIVYDGCPEKKEFKKERIMHLQETYKIQTLINKKSKKIIFSIQFPQKKIKIRIQDLFSSRYL